MKKKLDGWMREERLRTRKKKETEREREREIVL